MHRTGDFVKTTRFPRFRGWTAAVLLLALATWGCNAAPRAAQDAATAQDPSLERVRKAGVLLWGADVVGGIPYVYEDPKHTGQYIGFEMEIAQGVAKHLGVKAQ